MKKSLHKQKPDSGPGSGQRAGKKDGTNHGFDDIGESESVEMKRAVSPAAPLAFSASAIFPALLDAKQKEELRDYAFSFDAIVFEGGGNKGLSSVGAVRVLEELGYWKNITRFSGASAGAMVAALLSIGYSPYEVETFLRGDIKKVFLDASFGFFSFLPNMIRKYGWNPGKKIYEWFGDKMQLKMKNPDLTFGELYKLTKRELCITVTNINSMDCTYCHAKTTPDMPIRLAVRMSACIPGVFCPVKVKSRGRTDYYVDGGLVCNYPIHCYDGWFLSMDPDDTFLRKLQPVKELGKLWDPKERFGETNNKTFGILLYSGEEREVMTRALRSRFHTHIKSHEKQGYPKKSKLAKKRAQSIAEQESKAAEHDALLTALSRFLKVLHDNDIDHSGTISREEFEKAMEQENSEFTKEDKKRLFGDKHCDTEALFRDIDTKADGELTFRELLSFAEGQGLEIMEYFRGYSPLVINNLKGYFGAIMETLLLNMKRIFVKNTDIQRTIGIDTGYLDTMDFKMEPVDQDYIVEQGKLGCIAFLRELIAE